MSTMRGMPARVPHRGKSVTALDNSHSPITKRYSTKQMRLLPTLAGSRKAALSFREIPAIHSKAASAETHMALSRSANIDNRASGIKSMVGFPPGRFILAKSDEQHTCTTLSVSHNASHAVCSGRRMYTPCSSSHDKSASAGPFARSKIPFVDWE